MPKLLVTGATGYVGGRLAPRLMDLGYDVRASARSLNKLKSRPWANYSDQVELVEMDVFNYDSLCYAMQGCDIVFYLIHSMNQEHSSFSYADKRAAKLFSQAAAQSNVQRIIYLGGLGEGNDQLSPHLASRREVGEILQNSGVPTTILQAAMIIGSGSASFEILRYLVERLPVMLAPKWVNTPTQPIAIRNVLDYLIGCVDHPETAGQTYDIGGPDILTYLDLMKLYATEAGLPERRVLRVPFFSPKLSSYWIHFITPVSAALAQPLAEGLKNKTVCGDTRIQLIIPQTLYTCRYAIHLALERYRNHQVETHWTDAGKLPSPENIYPGDPQWSGGTVYLDRRRIVVKTTSTDLWEPIIRIGGQTGWYYGNILWQLRGLLDIIFGGVGLHRGRRNPDEVHIGDALDFWRVLDVQTAKRLFLLAEMRLPGDAYLEFELTPLADELVQLTQTARFTPKGLMGIAYWFAVMPLHHFVFNGMLTGIAKAGRKPILSGPEVLHS